MGVSVFPAQRRRLILAHVQAHDWVSSADLAALCDVSLVTVRRDLAELASQGLLTRLRGGVTSARTSARDPSAVSAAPPPRSGDDATLTSTPARLLEDAQTRDAPRPTDAELALARAALPLLHDATAVFIGAGTLTTAMATVLAKGQSLTVVTNSITVAEVLAGARDIEVVLTGGSLDAASLALVGAAAEQSLTGMRASHAVLTGAGMSAAWGLSDADLDCAGVHRALAAASSEVVVLLPGGQVGRNGLIQTVPTDRVAHLVTDTTAPPDEVRRLERAGVIVHVSP